MNKWIPGTYCGNGVTLASRPGWGSINIEHAPAMWVFLYLYNFVKHPKKVKKEFCGRSLEGGKN